MSRKNPVPLVTISLDDEEEGEEGEDVDVSSYHDGYHHGYVYPPDPNMYIQPPPSNGLDFHSIPPHLLHSSYDQPATAKRLSTPPNPKPSTPKPKPPASFKPSFTKASSSPALRKSAPKQPPQPSPLKHIKSKPKSTSSTNLRQGNGSTTARPASNHFPNATTTDQYYNHYSDDVFEQQTTTNPSPPKNSQVLNDSTPHRKNRSLSSTTPRKSLYDEELAPTPRNTTRVDKVPKLPKEDTLFCDSIEEELDLLAIAVDRGNIDRKNIFKLEAKRERRKPQTTTSHKRSLSGDATNGHSLPTPATLPSTPSPPSNTSLSSITAPPLSKTPPPYRPSKTPPPKSPSPSKSRPKTPPSDFPPRSAKTPPPTSPSLERHANLRKGSVGSSSKGEDKGPPKSQIRRPSPTKAKPSPRPGERKPNPKQRPKSDPGDSDSDSSGDDVFENLTPKELKDLERILRSKEEALVNMQNQLRQRETQVFVLEEQTIELLENEDKRLKDKESELRHWEKVLKKEVRRRLSAEGSLPPELRDIDTDSTVTDTGTGDTGTESVDLSNSNSVDKEMSPGRKKGRRRRSDGTKEHCIVM